MVESSDPDSPGRGGGNLLQCVPSVGRATLQAVDAIASLAATRSLWRMAIPPAGIGMMEQYPLAHGTLGPPDGTVSPDGSRTGRTPDARAAGSRSAPAPRRAYQMSRRRRAGYPRSRPRSLDQSATASTCRVRPAEAAAYHDGLPAPAREATPRGTARSNARLSAPRMGKSGISSRQPHRVGRSASTSSASSARLRTDRSAPAECDTRMKRNGHRSDLRIRGAANGSRRCGPGPSMSARESTSSPQSGHVAGSGSRTSIANSVRQPKHSPATVSRRSGSTTGRCAPRSC